MKPSMHRLISLTVIVISILLGGILSAHAQEDEQFTEFAFPNDIAFAYPANRWTLNDDMTSDFLVVLQSDEVLATFMQVNELNTLFGDTPMGLEFILQTYGENAAQAWDFDFDIEDFETIILTERKLYALPFAGEQDDSLVTGFVVVVPYSDSSGYGQITTYAVGEAPPQYAADVLLIAATLDNYAALTSDMASTLSSLSNAAREDAAEEPESVDVSAIDLPNTFEFPDYTFAYPDSYALLEGTESDIFVMLQSDEVLAAFVQVNELNTLFGGVSMDLDLLLEIYGGNAAQTWRFDFETCDFDIVEVDGRDLHVLAFDGEQNDLPATGFVILVPYSDESGYGQITAYAVGDAPAAFRDEVLAMAASFDVNGD